MEQSLNNQKQNSVEAEIALLRFREQSVESYKKAERLKRVKIYAIIIFLLVNFFAGTIFSILNWPSEASSRILGISFTGLFIILLSENIGKYTGNLWLMGRIGTNITRETPASVLRFLGWVFIFMPILIALLNLA
jgi:hypothetical protein